MAAPPKSLTISAIGFVAFLLGYSFYLKGMNEKTESPKYTKIIDSQKLNYVSVILLLVFLATVDRSFFTANQIKGLPLYIAFIFECSVNATIIINCRNLLNKGKSDISFKQYLASQKTPLIIMGIYLIIILFSGDRGPIIYNLALALFGYIYVTKKKISAVKVAGLLIVGAIAVSLLGQIRQISDLSFVERTSQVLSQTEIQESRYYPHSFLEGTKELAMSARSLNIAVSNVPSQYEHTYGLFMLQDIMLLVPSLRGLFVDYFNIPAPLTTSPRFLSWLDLGAFSTWGVGTTCTADIYLDFGLIGILVIFLLFGYVVRRLELIGFSNAAVGFPVLIVIFLFFAYSIYIPRATIIYALSKFTYIYLFILASMIITSKEYK